METSYLKAHPFGNRYPDWMPNLHLDCGQDSNPCTRGSQGFQSTSDSTVPRRVQQTSGAVTGVDDFISNNTTS